MSNKVKAILHDWDDTIVDSFDAVFSQYYKFSKIHNLTAPDKDAFMKAWGRPANGILASLWPTEDESVLESYFKAFLSPNFTLPPFPGVLKTIRELHNSGLYLGIVSSSPKATFLRTVNKYITNYEKIFIFYHTADDCTCHKPDPRVFNNAFNILNTLHIDEEQSIYIGDSLNDFFCAKARGLEFLAVTTGFTSSETFLSHGLPKGKILNSFNELPSYLSRN